MQTINDRLEVLLGTNITLLCRARGTLKMSFTWRQNGMVLQEDSLLSVDESSYIITSAEPSMTGNYSCSVGNSLQLSSNLSDTTDELNTTSSKWFWLDVVRKLMTGPCCEQTCKRIWKGKNLQSRAHLFPPCNISRSISGSRLALCVLTFLTLLCIWENVWLLSTNSDT